MLTPEDIDRQQFSKQFKGYAVEEVDDFLEELTNDYEVLMLANKKQEDRIKDLETKLEGISNNTNILQETLLIAKQTADDMKKRAEEEANIIVAEAKKMLEDRARYTRILKKRNRRIQGKSRKNAYRTIRSIKKDRRTRIRTCSFFFEVFTLN